MLFDQTKIDQFSFDSFQKRWPFPWFDFENFLTPEAFKKLYDEFPTLEFFEYHQGLKRYGGQRPHDRYYLAYESSIYRDGNDVFPTLTQQEGKGKIKRDDLKETWRAFMDELEGPLYRDFIEKVLGTKDFHIRYAWHMGKSTNEVSPHRDDTAKVRDAYFLFQYFTGLGSFLGWIIACPRRKNGCRRKTGL